MYSRCIRCKKGAKEWNGVEVIKRVEVWSPYHSTCIFSAPSTEWNSGKVYSPTSLALFLHPKWTKVYCMYTAGHCTGVVSLFDVHFFFQELKNRFSVLCTKRISRRGTGDPQDTLPFRFRKGWGSASLHFSFSPTPPHHFIVELLYTPEGWQILHTFQVTFFAASFLCTFGKCSGVASLMHMMQMHVVLYIKSLIWKKSTEVVLLSMQHSCINSYANLLRAFKCTPGFARHFILYIKDVKKIFETDRCTTEKM